MKIVDIKPNISLTNSTERGKKRFLSPYLHSLGQNIPYKNFLLEKLSYELHEKKSCKK